MFENVSKWKVIVGFLFALYMIISVLTLWGDDALDCNLPENSAAEFCSPEEDNVTGWDPNGPGEPWDGGDFPAP